MQLSRRDFAAGTVAASASLAGLRVAAQPDATPTVEESETIASLMAIMERHGVPGAVIALSTRATPEPEYFELGVANLETGEPVTTDMHFRIASVTKTFVATVVLQLVDEGLLTLDVTIADILPDLNIVNRDVVTIRQLLNMRAGLPQLSENPGYAPLINGDPEMEVSIDQIFALAVDLPARFEPDARYEYNNLNYSILGVMIQALTGSSWDENVRIRISEPLGLTNTLMTNSPELPAPSSRGYGYFDQNLPGATPSTDVPSPAEDSTPVTESGAYDLTAFNPTVAGAAGGLISTVQDQLRWATALAAGDLLSPEMHAAQIDALPVDANNSYGYGLGIIRYSGLVAHNGAISGFQSAIGASALFGLSVAVLTNANPTIGMADAAFELVVELLT